MLYLIGEPAVGKTTAVRRLTRGVPFGQHQAPYVYYTVYGPGIIQLGWDRESFGGTDSLGMAAQKHVISWLALERPKYVLGEGDRLANQKFFDAVRDMGYDLTVMAFVLDEATLKERREKRNAEMGKAQNDRWLATRHTKVRNLIAAERQAGHEVVEVDAAQTPKEIARILLGHPVARAIRKCKNS